ncbi:MAG: thiamine biosynthesis lipoprotein [Glaciecola sp.]
MSDWKIQTADDHIKGSFFCMASHCELLIDTTDPLVASYITEQAATEAFRIEQKFSRYRDNNIVSAINQAQGQSVVIDDETFQLLTFANTCFDISDGMFDITSGVLRRAWKFDGSDNVPNEETINQLLAFIGWDRVNFDQQQITMPAGFEIDLGGIGKEYAVDCVAKLCTTLAPTVSVLVNFGGDIQVTQQKKEGKYWLVGIEMPAQDVSQTKNARTRYNTVMVKIARGGLATSGDANRYLLHNGIRYSHVLNPQLGKPIMDGPRSVTIASDYCVQAGLMATLALLQGKHAEQFLIEQDISYWCYW